MGKPSPEIGVLMNGVIGLCLLTITPFLFAASNPVLVESREINSAVDEGDLPFIAPVEAESNSSEQTAGETMYQMQLLQQEVQQLRGLVEELTYNLSRMKMTQDERYLELDGRFQALNSGSSGQTNPVSGSGSETSPDAALSDEGKALYETAIELIRKRQYDLAITQLQSLISQFPDSSLAPNAYYWLGEVYAAKPEPDYENARKALAQVITFFPENHKVPDAAFKLGKVYHLMGDCERATDLLNQVIQQHQGKSVAKLAESYLRDKVGSCP